jgi:hypothetical protein
MPPMSRRALIIALVVVAGCANPQAATSPTDTPVGPSTQSAQSASPAPSSSPSPSPSPEPVVLVAAGDIASCDETGDSATAALIAAMDDDVTIATLGDSVYPSGSETTYAECYDPVWGAWRDRTRPAVGNHDVEVDGGAAYHAYFGDQAGRTDVGWYSYDIGAWHTIVLDSNCDLAGCAPGTAQLEWLEADLAASDATCTLAYWHHPRFTSGPHRDTVATAPFWDALYDAGADVVLDGHDHLYERFAPQDPDGSRDAQGIRQFTVGTGGKQLYPPVRIAPNSEQIIASTFGVLELTLRADSYDWRFVSIDGTDADAGSADCH